MDCAGDGSEGDESDEDIPAAQLVANTPLRPTEQHVIVDQGPLSVDEHLAQYGLSAKLFVHQVPDLYEISHSLELISQAVENRLRWDGVRRGDEKLDTGPGTAYHQQRMEHAISLAHVVLRAIRGAAGVRWAGRLLMVRASLLIDLQTPIDRQIRGLAQIIHEASQLTQKAKAWMSHRETPDFADVLNAFECQLH